MKKTPRILMCVLIGMAALSLVAFAPLPAAQPVAMAAATRTPVFGEQIDRELSFALQREQNWLARQQIHLTQASQIAVRAQDLIDRAEARGLDVTDLRNALADFNATIPNAQASHDQAAGILEMHNGFDADGNVTDRQAAHQTVVDARNHLRQAHLTLTDAILSLRTAVLDWRIENQNQ